MKRIPSLLTAVLLIVVTVCSFFGGCGEATEENTGAQVTLKVMSWEDYIDDDDYEDEENDIYEGSVVEEFEKYCKETLGKNVKVEYSTVGTNEEMYTKINLNKESYDLVCPSEYMIQKMISENMLEPLDRTNNKMQTYDENVSAYIADLFKRTKIDKDDDSSALYNYAACYMWGTMGFIYNPEFVDTEDVKNWSAVWMDKYKNKFTIKDSVRDSYVLAIGYAYSNELKEYANELKKSLTGDPEKDEQLEAEYNAKITDLFNSVSDESIEKSGKALSELASKLYGYEVDSGKKDMAAGKIWINFAWSGDAVYAMDFAEDPTEVGDKTAELYYVVPEEGSNIFFDGWVMPKGAKVDLAQEFINFVSTPHYAQRNMDYIGYTTSIASDEIFENVVANYGYESESVTEKDGAFFATDEDGNEIEVFPVDLSYLFKKETDEEGKEYVVYTDTLGRQFSTQYPDYETVKRCTVMRHFSDEELVKLNKMWENSKYVEWQGVFVVSMIVLAALVLAYVIIKLAGAGVFRLPVRKGYKRID